MKLTMICRIIRLEKAKNLLDQAKLLLDNKKFDGSINRSYYALFHSIRSLLALVSLDSTKHAGILSFFDRYFVKTGVIEKEYSKTAHLAFDARQDSDYEDFYEPSEEECRKQYELVKSFITELEKKRQDLLGGIIELPRIEL